MQRGTEAGGLSGLLFFCGLQTLGFERHRFSAGALLPFLGISEQGLNIESESFRVGLANGSHFLDDLVMMWHSSGRVFLANKCVHT